MGLVLTRRSSEVSGLIAFKDVRAGGWGGSSLAGRPRPLPGPDAPTRPTPSFVKSPFGPTVRHAETSSIFRRHIRKTNSLCILKLQRSVGGISQTTAVADSTEHSCSSHSMSKLGDPVVALGVPLWFSSRDSGLILWVEALVEGFVSVHREDGVNSSPPANYVQGILIRMSTNRRTDNNRPSGVASVAASSTNQSLFS